MLADLFCWAMIVVGALRLAVFCGDKQVARRTAGHTLAVALWWAAVITLAVLGIAIPWAVPR